LTFKGPSQIHEGVRIRQEIEFTVGDFNSARKFLEELGYLVVMIYEKYRTVYELDEAHITLDKLPYGDFVEIEGKDTASIHAVNQKIGLIWDNHVAYSYTVLFDQLRDKLDLPFRDLIFENFRETGLSITALNNIESAI
jgi:adenylate cyclase class 2